MFADAIEYSAPSRCRVTSAFPSSTVNSSSAKESADCSDASSSVMMTEREVTLYGSMFSASVIITENASVPSARSSSQMRKRRYCTSSPGAKWIVCSAECGIAATCSGRIWERIASVRLPLTPLEPSSRVGSPVAASFSIARRLFVELTASLPATDSTEAEATESRSEALASSSSRSASTASSSSKSAAFESSSSRSTFKSSSLRSTSLESSSRSASSSAALKP